MAPAKGIVAFVGDESWTLKDSAASLKLSSRMLTSTVLLVSPGKNVNWPLAAW